MAIFRLEDNKAMNAKGIISIIASEPDLSISNPNFKMTKDHHVVVVAPAGGQSVGVFIPGNCPNCKVS